MDYEKRPLSAGQLAMYASCPRRYAFRFVHRLEPDYRTASAAFARTLGSTLDELHSARLAGETHRDATKFVRIFRADWQSELDQGLSFKADESANLLRWMGEDLVAKYFRFVAQRPMLAAGEPFEVDLVDPDTGEVSGERLRGTFDVVYPDDLVMEVKARSRPYTDVKLAQRLQLSAYAYAYRTMRGRDPRLMAVSLLKRQHPALEQIAVTRSTEDDAFFFHLAVETADAIAQECFPPNVGFTCEDCEFARSCRRWRGDRGVIPEHPAQVDDLVPVGALLPKVLAHARENSL